MQLEKSTFRFLQELARNNNRDWFQENKSTYEKAKENAHAVFENIDAELVKLDDFQKFKMYRIYRDVRFSKDKSPYKNYFSCHYGRLQPQNRGGFYVHLEPGNRSFVGGGFWNPNKEDLLTIRKAIEAEDDLEKILQAHELKQQVGNLAGENVKTAPKGFDKEHPRIQLLRHKQFLLRRGFSDAEVLDKNFSTNVISVYQAIQPFFYYLTEVLTTDENGESIL